MFTASIRRSSSLATLGLAGMLTLGCSGLVGYGAELGSTQVQPGQKFVLKFDASKEADASHKAWLEYTVQHSRPYLVTGDFELMVGKQKVKSWKLDLTSQGSPVVGQNGRVTMNSRSASSGGKGNMSETVRLTALDGLKPGDSARIVGTFAPGSGTTLTHARLVVTD